MAAVRHYFCESIPEQRFVERQLRDDLPQAFPHTVGPLDELCQRRERGVECEPFAGDVVGLVVYDSAVSGRAARHQRQCLRKEVVASPAPVSVVRYGRMPNLNERVHRIVQGERPTRFCFFIVHILFDFEKKRGGAPDSAPCCVYSYLTTLHAGEQSTLRSRSVLRQASSGSAPLRAVLLSGLRGHSVCMRREYPMSSIPLSAVVTTASIPDWEARICCAASREAVSIPVRANSNVCSVRTVPSRISVVSV